MTLLMGLNESFTQTRGQVLLMDPLPSINMFSRLLFKRNDNKRMACDRMLVWILLM